MIAACQSPRLAATGSEVMAVLDTPDDASGFVLHNEDSIQSPQAKLFIPVILDINFHLFSIYVSIPIRVL